MLGIRVRVEGLGLGFSWGLSVRVIQGDHYDLVKSLRKVKDTLMTHRPFRVSDFTISVDR